MAGDFETTADIYRYLLGGGKVRAVGWRNPNSYVHMVSDALVHDDSTVAAYTFHTPWLWSKYIEPPKSFDNMGDALTWMLKEPKTRRVRDSRGTDWFWKEGVLYAQYQRGGFHDSSPQIPIGIFNHTFVEVK